MIEILGVFLLKENTWKGGKTVGSNVTLKQIAEELGVSAMTVSRALNN